MILNVVFYTKEEKGQPRNSSFGRRILFHVCLFRGLHCSKLEHFSQDNTIAIKDFIVTERR